MKLWKLVPVMWALLTNNLVTMNNLFFKLGESPKLKMSQKMEKYHNFLDPPPPPQQFGLF